MDGWMVSIPSCCCNNTWDGYSPSHILLWVSVAVGVKNLFGRFGVHANKSLKKNPKTCQLYSKDKTVLDIFIHLSVRTKYNVINYS